MIISPWMTVYSTGYAYSFFVNDESPKTVNTPPSMSSMIDRLVGVPLKNLEKSDATESAALNPYTRKQAPATSKMTPTNLFTKRSFFLNILCLDSSPRAAFSISGQLLISL